MTSFGRQPMSIGHLTENSQTRPPSNPRRESKWPLFRDLTKAQKYFGVNDRDLTVLNALLSFHPSDSLGEAGLIVFPSNKSLTQRAHGMPESTLRRHLAKLIKAGLITRQDSPNGKRYARRGPGGLIHRAYGFDLTPLVKHANAIRAAVEKIEAEQAALAELREDCFIALRECKKLLETIEPNNTTAVQTDDEIRLAERRLRRKPEITFLTQLRDELHLMLETLLQGTTEMTDASVPLKVSAIDDQNERHIQKSNTEIYLKEARAVPKVLNANQTRSIPHEEIGRTCPLIIDFSPTPITSQRDMHDHSQRMSSMMGVQPALWQRAIRAMGPDYASATIAAILQMASQIKAPPAYFATLVQKAEKHHFTPKPMLKRLLALQGHPGGQAS